MIALDIAPETFVPLFRLIWNNQVNRAYATGTINSERALQASIVSALAPLCPDVVTLVEPTLYDGENARPDLWIGTKGQALAIVELKFVPHAKARWEDDFDKLTNLLARGVACAYTVDPATGRDSQRIGCSGSPVGIYAVIARSDSQATSTETLRRRVFDRSSGWEGAAERRSVMQRILHCYGIVPGDGGGEVKFDASWLITDSGSTPIG